MNVLLVILLSLLFVCGTICVRNEYKRTYLWKLFGYNIDGVIYTNDSDFEHKQGTFTFEEELLEDHEKFLIRKNLVPNHINYNLFRTIISIPRTRPGIPFTLNEIPYFSIYNTNHSPLLKPYPSSKESKNIISVYETAIDGCERYWFVDTGFVDIPGVREQVVPPSIYVFQDRDNYLLHTSNIDASVLKEGVSAGLRSLTIDYIFPCNETFAYISDDNGDAVIAFSFEEKRFWRIERQITGSEAWTFPIPQSILLYAENVIRYRKSPNETFVHYSDILKNTKISQRSGQDVTVDLSEINTNPRGILYDRSYDGSILFFTDESRTNLYCWNMDTPMDEDNIELLTDISRDNSFYISAMNIVGRGFHFMVNRFRNSSNNIYDENKMNFAMYKADVYEIFNNSKCNKPTICSEFLDIWDDKVRGILSPFKYMVKYLRDEYLESERKKQIRLG
ncbi:L-dopachrome tautomerase yellow-f-like [Bombyx mandarina]|uniref:L-dopachrome tautomerase yellow-f-like n=1 Tax=Bombyx mandarina TaxID=7092 RepID=A0A6J2JVD4_BOMMA|nr:L-dopachrome tautomerase yellow-f-like [Bombyx mandarina]